MKNDGAPTSVRAPFSRRLAPYVRGIGRSMAMVPLVVMALVRFTLAPTWSNAGFLAGAIMVELLLRRIVLFKESSANLKDLTGTFAHLRDLPDNVGTENQPAPSWALRVVDPTAILYESAQTELRRKRKPYSSKTGVLILSVSNGCGAKLAAYRLLFGTELTSIVLCPYKKDEILRKPMIRLMLQHEAGHVDMKMQIWSASQEVYWKLRFIFFALVLVNFPVRISQMMAVVALSLLLEWLWRRLPSSRFARVLDEIAADNFALRNCPDPEAIKRYKSWVSMKCEKPQPWDTQLSDDENRFRREVLLFQIDLKEKNQLTEGLLDMVVNPSFITALVLLCVEIAISAILNWSAGPSLVFIGVLTVISIASTVMQLARHERLHALLKREFQLRLEPGDQQYIEKNC